MQSDSFMKIMQILVKHYKPYIDQETDVMQEILVYKLERDQKETVIGHVSRKQSAHRDVKQAWGQKMVNCPKCNEEFAMQQDMPEVLWKYIFKKHARLSEEQRKLIYQWGPTRDTSMEMGKDNSSLSVKVCCNYLKASPRFLRL